MLTEKSITRAIRGYFPAEVVLEETLMKQFLMINKNLSNNGVESNDQGQTDRNNQILYMIKLK